MTEQEKLHNAFTNSIKLVVELTGSCPQDKFGYYMDCDTQCCEGKEFSCWKQYFIDTAL